MNCLISAEEPWLWGAGDTSRIRSYPLPEQHCKTTLRGGLVTICDVPRLRREESTSTRETKEASRGIACAIDVTRMRMVAKSAVHDTFILVHRGKDVMQILFIPILDLLICQCFVWSYTTTLCK